ncbi:MAG: hypothetical protein IJ113_03250 [Eggerthellaceae bacterium]|nr:hypothetical protein [Eggerthellaceae bacterium]
MKAPSHEDAFQALLLQAAGEGRGEVLFADSLERVQQQVPPFLVGDKFPSVYLEFPLLGDPFLDVTLLYSELAPGVRIEHPAAAGSEGMMDWFAGLDNHKNSGANPGPAPNTNSGANPGSSPNTNSAPNPSQGSKNNVSTNNKNGASASALSGNRKDLDICCGFELDTKNPELPAAAVHFQPRAHTELVRPFCEAVGEPDRAKLYLDMAARMPEGWPLSFFGMFRGRHGSPLRVCGYMGADEKALCAQDPQRLMGVFDSLGFTAYDDTMVQETCTLLGLAGNAADFQFDVYPDGSLGDTFALDNSFDIERPENVQDSFANGPASRVMQFFQERGVADERWHLSSDMTFARAIPVSNEDGSKSKYAFVVFPKWVKARWRAGVLQPAKMYTYVHACFL